MSLSCILSETVSVISQVVYTVYCLRQRYNDAESDRQD